MRIPSLFVVGILVGAAVVFVIRAAGSSTRPASVDPASAPSAAPEGPAPHAARSPAPEPHRAESHPPAAAPPSPGVNRLPENRICPVMGNPVNPEVYVDYRGRRIGFCCPGCDKAFLEDPEKYLPKVDAELRERDTTR